MADVEEASRSKSAEHKRPLARHEVLTADSPDSSGVFALHAAREPAALRAALSRGDVNSRIRTVTYLQRTIGNHAVTTLLSLQRQGSQGFTFDEENVDDPRRYSVVAAAEGELGKVAAKRKGETDPDTGRPLRSGWGDLDKYFEASYGGKPGSGYTPELQKRVKFHDAGWPQHWCGHFSVWALKAGGMNIGNWATGGGVSSVSGIQTTAKPKLGDVGYVQEPFQHHFIVEKVEGSTVYSIDGNFGTNSETLRYSRSRSAVTAFYRVSGVT